MPARRLLLALTVIAAVFILGVAQPASGEDVLRPPRPRSGQSGSLADLGEMALERLPWDTKIIRANLSADQPVAVAACYLMQEDLLVVSQTSMVYCMSRRDLTPRWVMRLRAPLAWVPSEGPGHYTFLVKATDGAYWVHAFRKRSGAEENGFPARMRSAASSGLANNGRRVFVASLGSPRNNRTLESISLADGKFGWGWRTGGLLWAAPVMEPTGGSVIIAGEDGTVTSLPAGMEAPGSANWARNLGRSAAITATPAVTPDHVVVGANDGTLRCLSLQSGEIQWMHGLTDPIRKSPWVLGTREKSRRASTVEGGPDIEVDTFSGIAMARNAKGLHAFDLRTGAELFTSTQEKRPICKQGRWVLLMDGNGSIKFRDAENGYEVQDTLSLKMFDLIPTNGSDGAIYGCTHDGGIVAAIPAK